MEIVLLPLWTLRQLKRSWRGLVHRYSNCFAILHEYYLGDFDIVGPGIGILFFRPFVFLSVVENLLHEHYIDLPVDLTSLWLVVIFPALVVDGFMWTVEVAAFIHRALFDPGPLAAHLERLFLELPVRSWLCSRWPFHQFECY